MTFRTLSSALALSMVTLAAGVFAQTPHGTLRGTVLDPSGALIPQAQVTIASTNGTMRTLASDSNGAFAVADLPVGEYSVSINATGFTNALETVQVAGAAVTREDVTLGISVEQQVDVFAR